jgi:hypothetical protein
LIRNKVGLERGKIAKSYQEFQDNTADLDKMLDETEKILETSGHLPFNHEKRYRFGKDVRTPITANGGFSFRKVETLDPSSPMKIEIAKSMSNIFKTDADVIIQSPARPLNTTTPAPDFYKKSVIAGSLYEVFGGPASPAFAKMSAQAKKQAEAINKPIARQIILRSMTPSHLPSLHQKPTLKASTIALNKKTGGDILGPEKNVASPTMRGLRLGKPERHLHTFAGIMNRTQADAEAEGLRPKTALLTIAQMKQKQRIKIQSCKELRVTPVPAGRGI